MYGSSSSRAASSSSHPSPSSCSSMASCGASSSSFALPYLVVQEPAPSISSAVANSPLLFCFLNQSGRPQIHKSAARVKKFGNVPHVEVLCSGRIMTSVTIGDGAHSFKLMATQSKDQLTVSLDLEAIELISLNDLNCYWILRDSAPDTVPKEHYIVQATAVSGSSSAKKEKTSVARPYEPAWHIPSSEQSKRRNCEPILDDELIAVMLQSEADEAKRIAKIEKETVEEARARFKALYLEMGGGDGKETPASREVRLQYFQLYAEEIDEERLTAQAKQRRQRLQDNKLVLYHSTFRAAADAIERSEVMKHGAGGKVGAGIYFAFSPEIARQKARSNEVVLEAEVMVGNQKHMQNCDGSITFDALLREGYDSVWLYSQHAVGNQEFVVYNWDQVTILRRLPM